MGIKLPGSYKFKKILLIVLSIISIFVLSYEFIHNRKMKIEKSYYKQEQYIGNNNEKNNSSEVLIENNTSEESQEDEDKDNKFSYEEEKLYDDAYNLFFSNKYEEAVKKSDELVNQFPSNPKGYNIRGIAKAYNGDFDGGLKDINKALEIDSNYGYALFNKGLTYELYGKMDEALKWYNKDLEIEDYEWTYYGIASIYGREGNVPNTIKYLKKAIEINPLVKDEAKTEEDFNPVRESQEFNKLINS